MRKLLWLALVAAGLWGGYWVVGATALERQTAAFFDEAAANGLVASRDDISVAGFPNRFDLTVSGVDFANPATGFGWKAPFVQLLTMTWKPWHIIAALPNDQILVTPDQSVTVTSDRMMASLHLHPASTLGLYETRLEAAKLGLTSDRGWAVGVEKLFASTLEDATNPNIQRLGITVDNLSPDAAVLAALAATDLPALIETLHLDASASFSAPIALNAPGVQPLLMAVDIKDARIIWGALKLTATGALTAGPDGVAAGTITIRIDGWRRLPAVIAALGWISPDMAPNIERGLEVMAKAGPDPDVLELLLVCADGRMSLGPFPLGPAPQFFGTANGV